MHSRHLWKRRTHVATWLASHIDIWTFMFTRRLHKRPLSPIPLQWPTQGQGGGYHWCQSQEDGTVLGGSWAGGRGCISISSEGGVWWRPSLRGPARSMSLYVGSFRMRLFAISFIIKWGSWPARWHRGQGQLRFKMGTAWGSVLVVKYCQILQLWTMVQTNGPRLFTQWLQWHLVKLGPYYSSQMIKLLWVIQRQLQFKKKKFDLLSILKITRCPYIR